MICVFRGNNEPSLNVAAARRQPDPPANQEPSQGIERKRFVTLREVYDEIREEMARRAQTAYLFADVSEQAEAEADPARSVQILAGLSRAIHAHQAQELKIISRQLLWLQSALMARWPELGDASE
jgi:hypothetical protein